MAVKIGAGREGAAKFEGGEVITRDSPAGRQASHEMKNAMRMRRAWDSRASRDAISSEKVDEEVILFVLPYPDTGQDRTV